jgi:hypothetical protein
MAEMTVTRSTSTNAPRPCLAVPVVVGGAGVVEDEDRQGRHRLVELERPETVAERGEEKRRRLARGTGDREHAGRDNPRARGGEHHLLDRLPAGRPQRERGLAIGPRHEPDHLLGASDDRRQHENGQGHRARDGREAAHRHHHQPVGRHAHHDRRDPAQDIGRVADQGREASATVLPEIDAGRDPQRHGDRRGERDDDERADDGVRHAAPDLADGSRHVRKELEIQPRDSLPQQVPHDEHEREHDEAGGDVAGEEHEMIPAPPHQHHPRLRLHALGHHAAPAVSLRAPVVQ